MAMQQTIIVAEQPVGVHRRRVRVDWKFAVGLVLVLGPLVAGLLAPLFVDHAATRVGTHSPGLAPSGQHLLGTDTTGRDIIATLFYSAPSTLEIGLLAGVVGTAIGVVLGAVSGYTRGATDAIIRTAADVMLGVPSLIVIVVIVSILGNTSLTELALIIAFFNWMGPTRAIRAQVLSLRELSYVLIGRLSGRNAAEIMFLEVLPNLLPLIMAGLVGAVASAMLGSVGLQLLGLGPVDSLTLGLMLQTAYTTGALSQGLWWWWAPPTVLLALLFIGLFLMSMALDDVANPRLKGRGDAAGPGTGKGAS